MFELFAKKRGNWKDDILSGLTVALALVPEAIAFSFAAGVDPLVGLWAAVFMGFITSSMGGRPGMISGATGAIAVVVIAGVMPLLAYNNRLSTELTDTRALLARFAGLSAARETYEQQFDAFDAEEVEATVYLPGSSQGVAAASLCFGYSSR